MKFQRLYSKLTKKPFQEHAYLDYMSVIDNELHSWTHWCGIKLGGLALLEEKHQLRILQNKV